MENNRIPPYTSSDATSQYNADARLSIEFEKFREPGMSYHYTRSVIGEQLKASDEQISTYLSRIQRGGLIQPFGCLLAVDGDSLKIICFSANCFLMLGLNHLRDSPDELLGLDVRRLFTVSSRVQLTNTFSASDISLLNPIWIKSLNNNRPFCAIIHRIDMGFVIDLEPTNSIDPALLLPGAVHSQKLGVQAISKLQTLSGGDIGAVYDVIAQEIQKLTGYDRVMVYKFHQDEHGEVVAEIRRSDLEPYLGLHYPATDIPQVVRFLFQQSCVRMICDCSAAPVPIIQGRELQNPLCLVNSTLRAPHDCHIQYMTNMGSMASLVMAVNIHENNEHGNNSTKLWGLVVCHHTSPRFVPFPLRNACQFIMQAFGLQLYMELQFAAHVAEKNIIRVQSFLCDMLLRNTPYAILNQSPSMMDMVKCDGAALYYYDGVCYLKGVTPTELQLKDIVEWLLLKHGDSTGLSTDSLVKTNYDGAALLGDAVCGMATAKVNSRVFLFWFRSHTTKEIKWGGARHHLDERDNDGRMNPRASFTAFVEMAKHKSIPWEASEIDAIHSLQLILRNTFQQMENSRIEEINNRMNEQGALSSMACEMVKLIETATTPIFGVDSSGLVNGWNSKMAQLTGLKASEAMGKSLVNEVVHQNSCGEVESLLHRAIQGEEERNFQLKLRKFGSNQKESVVYIVANTCSSRDPENNIIGVCFVGQDVTSEKIILDKFINLQEDYNAIVQSVNPVIPPIFASDENARCSEWNPAMEKLTGWMREEVIGKILHTEIFGVLCQFRDQDSLTKFMIPLYRAICGDDTAQSTFEFFNRKGKYVEVLLTANKRTVEGGKTSGCFCFLHTSTVDIPTVDLQLSLGERGENREQVTTSKELAYIRQELRNPLNGIHFIHNLLKKSIISDDQKQYLKTSEACERQIMSLIEDMERGRIEHNNVELKDEEFLLENLIYAIVSQVMSVLNEKKSQLLQEIPAQLRRLTLYGDQIRLQLVLSNFLQNIVHYSPPDGLVEFSVDPGLRLVQDGNESIHLHIRMSHIGLGIPAALIEEMFGERDQWTTQEGHSLNVSHKLLSKMNGQIEYARGQDKCSFLVRIELRTKK